MDRAAEPWARLESELERWGQAGRRITLWWRDDDAVDATPALNRLLDIAGEYGLPVGLAVIPELFMPSLVRRLEGQPVSVLQHGVAHVNRARAGLRSSEFPDGCDLEGARSEILGARCRLDSFGPLLEPVFVPPWNRMDPALLARLVVSDFAAVSAFGQAPPTTAGSHLVNTHVDVIDWRGDRGFVGHERALGALVEHLAQRRGAPDRIGIGEHVKHAKHAKHAKHGEEVTGLLTHHLVHDEATWAFLDELVRNLDRSGLVRWLPASELIQGMALRGDDTPLTPERRCS